MTNAAINPRVTVLMPVYNASATVADALESIFSQTFRDFELLVIDDGSSDSTAQIIESYNDPRLRFVANDHNLGVSRTLNKGLELAEGDYIARMDADDISLPMRLERQIDFMDSNPEVGACGTWVEVIGQVSDVWRYPLESDEIRARLLFHSVLAHPSVFIRRKAFIDNGLHYDEHYPHAEDFQLWQRASEYFPLANIGEILLKYTVRFDSVSKANKADQAQTLRRIDKETLLRLGIHADNEELNLHRCISEYRFGFHGASTDEAEHWLRRLIMANANVQCYPEQALRRVCGTFWLKICQHSLRTEGVGLSRFFRSPLFRTVSIKNQVGLIRFAIGRLGKRLLGAKLGV